jgi:hypothetical protein
MSGARRLLVAALCAVAALAGTAPSASAQAQTQQHGSCLGVLSAFAGSVQGDPFNRQDFAPTPGQAVAGIAHQKGTLVFCAGLIGL